mgnify:CR=1 FL=1
MLPFVCDSGCARVYLITRRFVTLFYTVLADTSGYVMPLVPPGLQLGGMEYISLLLYYKVEAPSGASRHLFAVDRY